MANRGLMVAIGLGKSKDKSGPPPPRNKPEAVVDKTTEVVTAPKESQAPPAQTPDNVAGLPASDDMTGGSEVGGIGPADVDYSDNDLCETCANMGQDGNCTLYGFPVQPSGHCAGGYTPQDSGVEELGEGTGTSGTEQPPL